MERPGCVWGGREQRWGHSSGWLSIGHCDLGFVLCREMGACRLRRDWNSVASPASSRLLRPHKSTCDGDQPNATVSPTLQQPWNVSLLKTASLGAHVGNFHLPGEWDGSRASCSLGSNREEATVCAGGWVDPDPPSASCGAASSWAHDGENEELELYREGRYMKSCLSPPSSPMGFLCTHCSAMMGAMHQPKPQGT